MEKFIPPEFDLHHKERSEEALKCWRDAVGKIVKNRRRRFRYAADLEKRLEAKEHLRRLRDHHCQLCPGKEKEDTAGSHAGKNDDELSSKDCSHQTVIIEESSSTTHEEEIDDPDLADTKM